MYRFSDIVCSSVNTAASIRLLGLPVFFNQCLNNVTALGVPSASPSTVPLSVFLTQPLILSSFAFALVNFRKNTPCTLPEISKWTNDEEAAEEDDEEDEYVGTETDPFCLVALILRWFCLFVSAVIKTNKLETIRE